MRGFASVLTVAFVFASASLLLGQAAGQASDPSYPEEYRQSPPDAFIEGQVTGPDGEPIEGAQVSSSSYAQPEPRPAEESEEGPSEDGNGNGTSGSSGSSIACCYYGGYNSTATDGDGRFVLGVWSGETQVSVYHPDHVSQSLTLSIDSGETRTQDFELEAYPEKTARVVGRVVDARSGDGLGFASVSVRSPLYGLWECSQPEGVSGREGGSPDEPVSDGDAKPMMYPYEQGCSITVRPDGSYDGYVTPGYTILSVYAYQDCAVTNDADGGSTTTCGPEYLPFSRTLNLPADEETRIDVRLQSRPSPDATVSGYLVDVETGEAVREGSISFSNQETYAWGSATTDSDGSFKIRLRSGYHQVSVYAPGYLSWEGVLQVKAGSTDFDVKLTPGQESYGGCCIAYAERSATDVAVGAPAPMGGKAAGQADGADEDGLAADASGERQYEDLGGGLGPYDAEERGDAIQNSQEDLEPSDGGSLDIPSAGTVLALAALGAVLVLRRRSA